MPSPYPDIQHILKVKRLHDRDGLTFREISKAVKGDEKHVKTIWRWYHYDVGKLSTGKHLTRKQEKS